MSRVFGERIATGKSVVDSAMDRIRHAYSVSDHQVVLFSGGKDSSVLLNLVIAVATELGRTPVPVLFIDEEAIPPETVDYVRRVMLREDIALTWSCVPVKHRNACARSQPWWFPWKADERHLWCRDLPEWATTEQHRPHIPHLAIPDQMGYWCPPSKGTTVQFLGRRCQESLTRYRMVARRRGPEAFMSKGAMEEWKHIRTATRHAVNASSGEWSLCRTPTGHRISGISWKELAKVAGRGVLKQRTLSQISGYRGPTPHGRNVDTSRSSISNEIAPARLSE